MAYNALNKLKHIEEVQEIWASYQGEERSTRWIYRNHIRDKFNISERTLHNWLNRNVKKERRELAEKGIIESE